MFLGVEKNSYCSRQHMLSWSYAGPVGNATLLLLDDHPFRRSVLSDQSQCAVSSSPGPWPHSRAMQRPQPPGRAAAAPPPAPGTAMRMRQPSNIARRNMPNRLGVWPLAAQVQRRRHRQHSAKSAQQIRTRSRRQAVTAPGAMDLLCVHGNLTPKPPAVNAAKNEQQRIHHCRACGNDRL